MIEDTKDTKDTLDNFTELYNMMTNLIGSGQVEPMSPNRLAEAVSEAIGIYPVPNLAVDRCSKMFTQAAEEAKAEGKSADIVLKTAAMSYVLGIPPLTGADSIGDFIACVTRGMLLGAIPGPDATRLLYAAQVAHTAFPKRKTLAKILKKTPGKNRQPQPHQLHPLGNHRKTRTPPPLLKLLQPESRRQFPTSRWLPGATHIAVRGPRRQVFVGGVVDVGVAPPQISSTRKPPLSHTTLHTRTVFADNYHPRNRAVHTPSKPPRESSTYFDGTPLTR
jgi:hypothetical protein